jgi:hypothetical protein
MFGSAIIHSLQPPLDFLQTWEAKGEQLCTLLNRLAASLQRGCGTKQGGTRCRESPEFFVVV